MAELRRRWRRLPEPVDPATLVAGPAPAPATLAEQVAAAKGPAAPDVASEEYQRSLREQYLDVWRRGGSFQRPRVMPESRWLELQSFITQLAFPPERQPVLYALVDGKATLHPPRMKESAVTVFLVVFADGVVSRYAWRSGSRLTADRLAMSKESSAVVANIGGVPVTPELILVNPRRGYGFISHKVTAEEGGVAADVIRALYLDAARRPAELLAATEPRPDVVPIWKPPRPTPPPAPARWPAPSARLVRDAAEAELMAAEWVRWLGWPDAEASAPGADEGVDVSGREVVAQVKFEAVKTGRPALQALFGAGHALDAQEWLFFSSAGYTTQAVDWGTRVGMALFRFSLDGTIEPANTRADDLLRTGGTPTTRP